MFSLWFSFFFRVSQQKASVNSSESSLGSPARLSKVATDEWLQFDTQYKYLWNSANVLYTHTFFYHTSIKSVRIPTNEDWLNAKWMEIRNQISCALTSLSFLTPFRYIWFGYVDFHYRCRCAEKFSACRWGWRLLILAKLRAQQGAIWIEELPYSTSLPPWGLMKVQEWEWTLYRWEKAHTFFSTRSNHSARQELIGCDYSHTFACLRSNSDTKNSVIIIIGRSF